MVAQISFLVSHLALIPTHSRCPHFSPSSRPALPLATCKHFANHPTSTSQEGAFTLIHIPLDLYPVFLPSIIRVLLPQTQYLDALSPTSLDAREGLDKDFQHYFLNISVTSIECSVVCHKAWAASVFQPVIDSLSKAQAKTVSVFKESHLIMAVIGAGFNAAERIMELSTPFALAGIPIFFITTYYTDFIMVPAREKKKVIQVMLSKGFEMEEDQKSYLDCASFSGRKISAPTMSPPDTPPPYDINELIVRTFDLLQSRRVSPSVAEDLELVQMSGIEFAQLVDPYSHRAAISRNVVKKSDGWVEHVDTKLYTRVLSAFASKPRFFSLTLAQEDPPSLLMDKKLLELFGDSLIGDKDAKLTPIFLDLVSLPAEATGVVCGVAGMLIQELRLKDSLDLAYLSTACAGAVILPKSQSKKALKVLKRLLPKRYPDE